MFAIEALLESIRVPVQDLEELCEQSEDCMGRLVWLQDRSCWYLPFTFLLRPDWPHPPSVVMWSIKDATAIFSTQEDSLRTWAQEMVRGICRAFSVPWVWKNIIAAGTELVLLASSLAELSESLYKQQIMSLFDGSLKSTVHASDTRIEQPIDDNCVHVSSPKTIVARGSDGTLLRELPATRANCLVDNKLHKTVGKTEELLTLQGGLSCTSSDSVCQNCRLNQTAECIVCKHCKASYHQECVTAFSAAGGWCCPLCFLNQDTENAGERGPLNKEVLHKETQKELFMISSNATTEICQAHEISTGKAGICEACKKDDDNVLLCDACDAAYHMDCLSPPIESIPEGYWYCPACDEAGKRLMVLQQDTQVHNCAVCERVSRELLNCGENESTAGVFSKDTSPAYLAPECTMDYEYPDDNLDQGVPEICIENKAMDPDFFTGTGNVCKFCGLDEGKKAILCSNCQNCYHLSCLRPALRRRPPKSWFCPSCLCRICKVDVDDDKILLCELCDEGYHTYCLTPPLSKIPEAPWFCKSCIPSNVGKPKKKRKSNESRRSV
ncbi:hypothetical protein L7F22_023006 [Adiantum nelumboides]|nr:hypothetical protein [Adiantum nelumboides]